MVRRDKARPEEGASGRDDGSPVDPVEARADGFPSFQDQVWIVPAPDEPHRDEQISDRSSAGSSLADEPSGVCALGTDRSDLQTVLVLEDVKRDEGVAVGAQPVAAHQEPPMARTGIDDDGKACFVDILLVVDLGECPGRDIRVIIDLRALHEGVVAPTVEQVDCDGIEKYFGVADKHRISRPRIGDDVDTLACDSDSPVAETVRGIDPEASGRKLKRASVRPDVAVDGDSGNSKSQTAWRRDPLDRIGCLCHRSARGGENTNDQGAAKHQKARDSVAQNSNCRVDYHGWCTPCELNSE